ncbi:hypothetical protein F4811DRAFT_415813 [Daldinia bambusicola]|nr:hypothetical protein F4811DRAFT_415813 [Daldinia bambusicola]
MSSKTELRLHYVKQEATHGYCKPCQVPFRSREEYIQHVIQNPKSHAYCQQCCEVFPTKAALDTHKRVNTTHHYCEKCNIDFEEHQSLNLHLEKKHHYCKICTEDFVSSAALQSHWSQSDKHYYCSQCEHDFDDAQILATHIELQHNCRHEFDNKKCLETHISSCCPKVIAQENVANDEKATEATTHEEIVNEEVIIQYPKDKASKGEETDDGEITEVDSYSSESQAESSGIACLVCPKRFPSRLAMVNHCEEGDCREEFYEALRNEDKCKEFTADPVGKTSIGMGHFKCPQPYCGDLFSKFSGLIDHLGVAECGFWLEERGGDDLSYLKSYLS